MYRFSPGIPISFLLNWPAGVKRLKSIFQEFRCYKTNLFHLSGPRRNFILSETKSHFGKVIDIIVCERTVRRNPSSVDACFHTLFCGEIFENIEWGVGTARCPMLSINSFILIRVCVYAWRCPYSYSFSLCQYPFYPHIFCILPEVDGESGRGGDDEKLVAEQQKKSRSSEVLPWERIWSRHTGNCGKI